MKNILRHFKNQSGLTFIELMVAMLLVGLLTICIISANLFVQRFLKNYELNNRLYDDGNFILTGLKKDLKDCIDFKYPDSTTLTISYPAKDSVRYVLDSGIISRNGKALNTSGVSCNSLVVDKIGFVNPTPDSILIYGKYEYKAIVARIKLDLSVGDRSESFNTEMRVKNENDIY